MHQKLKRSRDHSIDAFDKAERCAVCVANINIALTRATGRFANLCVENRRPDSQVFCCAAAGGKQGSVVGIEADGFNGSGAILPIVGAKQKPCTTGVPIHLKTCFKSLLCCRSQTRQAIALVERDITIKTY